MVAKAKTSGTKRRTTKSSGKTAPKTARKSVRKSAPKPASKTRAKSSGASKKTTKKTTAKSKSSKPKYGKSSQKEVKNEMHRFKRGTAHSGPKNKPVKSRKQAIAIALSKARKKGAKVPSKAKK